MVSLDSTAPITSYGYPGVSVYKLFIALVSVYLVMRYAPGGMRVGLNLLILAFTFNQQAVSGVTGLLSFLANPTYNGRSL